MNNELNAAGELYTIGHIVLITSLTDRTIRNYISSGILQGEKIDGVWHFTPEQVQKFISDPAVYPSILAKKNAIVYDFLRDTKKMKHRSCVILDLPGENSKSAAGFFCHRINNGQFEDISFSFDSIKGVPRVILSGNPKEVMELVDQFYKSEQ